MLRDAARPLDEESKEKRMSSMESIKIEQEAFKRLSPSSHGISKLSFMVANAFP